VAGEIDALASLHRQLGDALYLLAVGHAAVFSQQLSNGKAIGGPWLDA
jgi:hypothetical protein